jgi:hypothetical protein
VSSVVSNDTSSTPSRESTLLTLATKARKCVELVEVLYSSNLNAEMNIDLLQL